MKIDTGRYMNPTATPNIKAHMQLIGMDGKILPKSKVNNIVLTIPKAELDTHLSTYWDEVKDVLPTDLVLKSTKGGFRKVSRNKVVKAAGGVDIFFRPVLCEVIETYLSSQDRQALIVNGIKLSAVHDDKYSVYASVTLEPEITWKKQPGILEPLNIKIPKSPDNAVELLTDAEIRHATDRQAVLKPEAQGTIAVEGLVAVVDCDSSIDGKPWTPGCVIAAKWPLEKAHMKSDEMYEALIGMNEGDVKDFSFTLNEKYGAEAGRHVTVHLRLIQLFSKHKPEINDDLAITNGAKTLEEWKDSLRIKSAKSLETAKNNIIRTMVLNTIIHPDVLDIEPVPFEWMASKAREIYNEARALTRTEDELVAQFGKETIADGQPVKTKEDVVTILAQKSAQQLVNSLIIRSWGRLKGVVGDSTLNNMGEYNKLVIAEMMKVAVIEEVDMTQEQGKVG